MRVIPLPGKIGSPEFMTAYNAALAALNVREIGKTRSAPGTVSAAIASYYTDNRFTSLAPGTQKKRREILESFRTEHGDKRLAGLQKQHVAAILGAKKPFAARNWLTALRGLMQFAVATGLVSRDPTAAFEPAKAKAGRIHTWTETEIEQYEARHPIGSRARLAMALLLYTGQRRGDVVVTATGAPFSVDGFGHLFREWCDAAGLPQCSAHGLRKAACRRLTEIGCSAPKIAAISGHKSLREVQRYIEEADQARLAQAAIRRMTVHSENTEVANLPEESGYPSDKSK